MKGVGVVRFCGTEGVCLCASCCVRARLSLCTLAFRFFFFVIDKGCARASVRVAVITTKRSFRARLDF